MKRRLSRTAWLILAGSTVAALLATATGVDSLASFGTFLLAVIGGSAVVLGTGAVLQWILWRVGRRLAFSYLLLGMLPLLLIGVMLAVTGYLLSGFYLGHLFRGALDGIENELAVATQVVAEHGDSLGRATDDSSLGAEARLPMRFVEYQNGVRKGDDPGAPELWPSWLLDQRPFETSVLDESGNHHLPALVALSADDDPVLAAAASSGDRQVLGLLDADLEVVLRSRSGVWTELFTDPKQNTRLTRLDLFGETFYVLPRERSTGTEEQWQFLESQGGSKPWLIGFELTGPIRDLRTGESLGANVSASLTADRGVIYRSLFSRAPELDAFGWVAFLLPAFLLFDLYLLAALMAIYMIITLSRAVNHLSTATQSVQSGDFGTRIPVTRKDQLGALQTSFNDMTANLEHLVSAAAEKEVLERELGIAQDVQESLLPSQVTASERYALAAHFEPSAAIAGDYWDIVELPAEEEGDLPRLALVVADVAGHGIAAGLRMAMLKAGMQTLVQEGKPPEEIMSALDDLVRSSAGPRSFVTATLALLDFDTATLTLTNAGHPPTYLIRSGEPREILLPGTPLGAFGHDFGQDSIDVLPDDIIVMLSDGIIEATNGDDEAFGYERVLESLRASAPPDQSESGNKAHRKDEFVEIVRDGLLGAVHRHTGNRPPEDDRTLVVLRLR